MDFADDIEWSATDVDEVEIPCPECGKTFEFGAWTLVNASENPEVMPKIIDGSISEFTCPYCGYTAHLTHPCLFIDPIRKLCIYSVIDDRMKDQAETMLTDPENSAAAASTCRIVTNRYDFAEKVLAFTNALDDRPIELLKFGIRGSFEMQGFAEMDEDVEVHLVGLTDDGQLSFSVICGEEYFSTDMARGAYGVFANALERSSIKNMQPLFVDKKWGEHALDIIEAEGTMD